MASRRVTFILDFDLTKASKEAHQVTIEKIANELGAVGVELMKGRGYSVRGAQIKTVMHYVRHDFTKVLVKPAVKRALRRVS